MRADACSYVLALRSTRCAVAADKPLRGWYRRARPFLFDPASSAFPQAVLIMPPCSRERESTRCVDVESHLMSHPQAETYIVRVSIGRLLGFLAIVAGAEKGDSTVHLRNTSRKRETYSGLTISNHHISRMCSLTVLLLGLALVDRRFFWFRFILTFNTAG